MTDRPTRDQTDLENALRESQQRLEALFELLPEGVGILDASGALIQANPALERILGMPLETMVKRDFWGHNYVRTDGARMRPEESATSLAAREQRIVRDVETGLVKFDGSVVWLSVSASPPSESGARHSVVVATDITERRKAQEALRESETRYRMLFNHATDAIWILSAAGADAGRIVLANPAAATMYGHTVDELETMRIADLEVPEAAGSMSVRFSAAGRGKRVSGESEHIRKDESVFPVEFSSVPIRFDGRPCILAFTRDITERKQAEYHLLRYQARLRALAAELVVSGEQERSRLGVELHDGIGQQLVAAKMAAQLLAAQPLDAAAKEDAQKLAQLLGEAINEVRLLTSGLAPTALFELGLRASLLWLRDRYSQLYDLKCNVRIDAESAQLRGEKAMFLFRVVRESLNNVVRHSGVLKASVTVTTASGWNAVSISDRGAGFDRTLVDEPGDAGGFGLFSIREQCLGMGGEMDISSQPGKGTRIRVRVPEGAKTPTP